MVFVLDSNNNSLSPTTNAKARRLLSSHKAFVFRLFPFVIKLKQSFKELGIDTPANINKEIEGAKQWQKEISSIISKLNSFNI